MARLPKGLDVPGGPVLIGGIEHVFTLDVYQASWSDSGVDEHRWMCSCGSKGRKNVGCSEQASYLQWLNHLDRERMSTVHLPRERIRRSTR